MLWRLASNAEDAGDFERARRFAEQGAALGDDSCWVQLGLLYDLGRGVGVDKKRAMQYYRKAWLRRNIVAANNIAILYKETGEHGLMFRWYRRASEHGDDEAFLSLAKCYRDGVGVQASPRQAMKCLTAALRGHCISEAAREEAEALLESYRVRVVK